MATIDFEKKSGHYGFPKITVERQAHEHDSKFKLYKHSLNSYSHQSFFCFKFRGLFKILFAYDEFKTDKVIFIEAYFTNDGSDDLIIFGFVTTKNVKKYFRFSDFANGKVSDTSNNYISEDQLRKELEKGIAQVTPQLILVDRDAIDIYYKTGADSYIYKGYTIDSSLDKFGDKYVFIQYKYSSCAKIIEGEFTVKYIELTVNFVGNVNGNFCNQVILYVSRLDPNVPIMIAFGISSNELRYIFFSEFVQNNELTINLSALPKITVDFDKKTSNYVMEGELLSILYQFNPHVNGLTIINTKWHTSYDNVSVSENPALGEFQSFTHKPFGEFNHTLIECGFLPFILKDYNPSDYGFDNLQHVVLYYSIATNPSIPLIIEIVTNKSKLHNSGDGTGNQSEFFVLKVIFEASQYYDGSTTSDEWSVTYEISDLKPQDVEARLKKLLKSYARPMELMPKPKHELWAFAVIACIFGSITLIAALAVLMPRYSRRIVKLTKKLYHIH
ncbi:hypothetical protein MACK_001038 [Theileria orientalis]|uniref:Uncharacterized protein n=1 Tax=Theileria orientalis TaxID=68886 RepID=A0A976MC77_THEOR|nr:hypothetical protein MACK_001038 [Theileria orientalis]